MEKDLMPEQKTTRRRQLKLTEAVMTIKQPALVGRCRDCNSELRVPLQSPKEMQLWQSGEEIQLDCSKCQASYRSTKRHVLEGTPAAFEAAVSHAAGAARVDRKLRGKVNGS
jgi:hypothetical protein